MSEQSPADSYQRRVLWQPKVTSKPDNGKVEVKARSETSGSFAISAPTPVRITQLRISSGAMTAPLDREFNGYTTMKSTDAFLPFN